MVLEGKKQNEYSPSLYLLRNALELIEGDNSNFPSFKFSHYQEIHPEFTIKAKLEK